MNTSASFSPAEIEALESFRDAISPARWALIGASAIRCRLPLPRLTADIDFAVAVPGDAVRARLTTAGWVNDPRKLQRWTRGSARVDVVSATEDDVLAGVVDLEDGSSLTVVGFDLAYSQVESLPLRDTLAVPVARLPVIVLLKMVAWLERPDRQRDLHDLIFILDNALADNDDVRWEPEHPLASANLDHPDQSAFYVGWELGLIAAAAHLHWAKRFVDVMRDDEGSAFLQLVREARYLGDDVESRLRARLGAFERGLEAGASRNEEAVETMEGRVVLPAPATLFGWGQSASIEKLFHDAIDARRTVRFVYQGHERVAEPHVLGTKNGRLQILTWQIAGTSSSAPLPGWRRFFVGELSSLTLTSESFSGARLSRGRHSSFDRQIAVVR